MKRSLKEWGIRVGILLAGLAVAHLGVTLFLLSDLGSDPFNVLIQGLFRTLQRVTGWGVLTHGRVHMAVSLVIIGVLLAVDRSYIKIGTVLCMAFGGPIIDFYTWILNPLFGEGTGLPVRIGMLVAVVISDKIRKPFSIIRVLVDAAFVAAGFLLGGLVGAGTLVCVVLVGPVAGWFLPVNGRLVERILTAAGIKTE